MKKILLVLLFSVMLLKAEETLHVSEFEVSIFSRGSKDTSQLEVSVIFEGRDVEVYDFKVIDALNIVIGSFYVEDLMTSKGKISLKQTLTSYIRKEYSIDIDNIYIQKLRVVQNASVEEIIKALKEEGFSKK